MYIDLKPEIRKALLNNAALFSLLDGDHVYPIAAPGGIETYITFQEISNFDNRYANDTAMSSSIHFQFDVWTPYNTGPIVTEVNRTMESLGFVRSGSQDRYEDGSYGKVLRYKTTKYLEVDKLWAKLQLV